MKWITIMLIVLIHAAVLAPLANAKKQLPPNFETWILIAKCEMPVKGVPRYTAGNGRSAWRGIAWNQTTNHTYNGLGMTRQNWETFRRPSQKLVDVHEASPLEQLWSAQRLWQWANKTYPGNGWTAWECSRKIGWTTSNPKDALR